VAAAQRRVVAAVLRGNGKPATALAKLETAHPREAGAYRDLLAELRGEQAPLSAYALAVRQLQRLAEAVSPS
jgi:NAD-specific glutamate dehydrogenase